MDWMWELCEEEGILVTLGLLFDSRASWVADVHGDTSSPIVPLQIKKRCPFSRACGLASGVLSGH